MLTAEFLVAGERLVMSPYRTLFWPRCRWLMLSDAQLGRTSRSPKAGHSAADEPDDVLLDRLSWSIREHGAERVIILGEPFRNMRHSSWDLFQLWLDRQACEVHLVLGEHDAQAEDRYLGTGVTVHADMLLEGPFALMPGPGTVAGHHVIGGQLDPGISVEALNGQDLLLPCFWSGLERTDLPAYGNTQGLQLVEPHALDRCFAVTARSVIDVSGLQGARRTHRGRTP
jgi:metallophosphoesterase superfamily enzyme